MMSVLCRRVWPAAGAVGWLLVACTDLLGIDAVSYLSRPDVPPDASPVDAGHGDAGHDGGGGPPPRPWGEIHCGVAPCHLPDVCCFDVDAGSQTCTPAAGCRAAPIACDDPTDCLARGNPPDFICCSDVVLESGGLVVTQARCVRPASCNALGPQDWLCDPTALDSGCSQPDWPTCKSYPAKPPGLSACGL